MHLPFSEVPVLKYIFERRVPAYGNKNTINVIDLIVIFLILKKLI